jgi:hypothetical protein
MSLEDLGNIGEFVAAVAVVVSLIYLALQIRQNTRSVASSTYQGIRHMVQEMELLLASDPELNRIWTIGRREPDSLDDEQWSRFSTLALTFYRTFENAYFERQKKVFDDQTYRPWEVFSLQLSAEPGLLRWWKRHSNLLTDEFQRYVERQRAARESTELESYGLG